MMNEEKYMTSEMTMLINTECGCGKTILQQAIGVDGKVREIYKAKCCNDKGESDDATK